MGIQGAPTARLQKQVHIVQLVHLLAACLMKTKVPEVAADLKGQESLDFDATLFVSSTAEAYPELYKACLQDWISHSQEQYLQGEVLNFITPIKTVHHNLICDIECCNHA